LTLLNAAGRHRQDAGVSACPPHDLSCATFIVVTDDRKNTAA
jgi:hypothetical protein